jgi:ubiquinone/menaquinone biosynthesis C-methylase UbiE
MKPEHPSTYFVENRSSKDDLTRLQIQDQMLTTAMGGVLPEQSTPAAFRRVLDVGCGTGGWLIETARTYPTIAVLAGVDVSNTMVEHARTQATLHQLDERVEFHVMDALRMLEFPDHFFDLVNQRSGASYLRTWDWRKLLQEYRRVLQKGGIVRISEGEWGPESTSPALTFLFDLLCRAFAQAGHSFSPERDGIICKLEPLLTQHGFDHIQRHLTVQEYHAGTQEWQHFFEDVKLTFRLILPFLRKWTRVPDDYEQQYQQALEEMQQPDFVARGNLLTVWGTAP